MVSDGAAGTAGPGRALAAEALGFASIGVISALGYVVLSGAMVSLFSAVPAWIVSICCYALFILPAYLAHRRFSFRSDAPHRRALPRYVVTQALALVLAACFSFFMYGVMKLPGFLASLGVIVLTSGVNFLVLRLWAFSTTRRHDRSPGDILAQIR